MHKVNTVITRDRCELTWQADFATLPKSFGPLSSMSLKPSGARDHEYEFSATLSCPTEDATTPGGSPLEDFTITVNVRFPGTVQNNLNDPDRVGHTGESVSWKTDAASLKSKTLSLTATVTPGRASEHYYWLILMVAFTVVIVLNVKNRVVGAVVDSVSDVLELNRDVIRPAPELSASTVNTSFIMGIGAVSDRMLILIDIEGLMSSADMGLMDSLTIS